MQMIDKSICLVPTKYFMSTEQLARIMVEKPYKHTEFMEHLLCVQTENPGCLEGKLCELSLNAVGWHSWKGSNQGGYAGQPQRLLHRISTGTDWRT